MRYVVRVVIGLVTAVGVMPASAAGQQPLAFVGAATTAAARTADSTARLPGASRLVPNTDCASVRIVFTVLGAGAGLGVGMAADLQAASAARFRVSQ